MRKFALLLGLTLTLALTASPVLAGTFSSAFDFDQSVTNAKAGAEAVLTAPVVPLFGLLHGDPVFNLDLPLGPIVDRLAGLVTGSTGGAFSLVTGLVDIVFALPASLTGITPVSPEPIINLFGEGAGDEDYKF